MSHQYRQGGHAQAQIRLIEFLQKKKQQFILTSHSSNLASKVSLENLIICKGDDVFPIKNSTELEKEDLNFLKRFLDVTKANLFFAEGVIIVEGDAENILIPTIAEIIGRPLHEWGVSIINVGSKALLRYAKIFKRKDKSMNIPVACVTDLDIKQTIVNERIVSVKKKESDSERKKLLKLYSKKNNIKVFSSPKWTMEYDLALGALKSLLFEAIFLAQLIQSRMKNQNFNGLSPSEIDERRIKARGLLTKWQDKYTSDNERIAFEIYKPLDNNSASKAITAQYLASFLYKDKERYAEILKSDPQINYIVQAIEHVTKPIE